MENGVLKKQSRLNNLVLDVQRLQKKVECKYKEEQKLPPVIQLAAVFVLFRSVLILCI